ncbi:MAG: tRNA pseudouridine(38-40) synthase TruA [Chloroflexi bacterium]|nr:tRNA pseudouridine(38-40) synthase TruA [Chloroflexota bacterium]
MQFSFRLQYDGTLFCGSQLQNNVRTVQGDLENSISKVFSSKIRVKFSSRTDSGVHAYFQVGSFSVKTDMTTRNIAEAINYYLSDDVQIICIHRVKMNDFDPRGDAINRTYTYRLSDCKSLSVLSRKYVTKVKKKIDIKIMKYLSNKLVGKHDFSSFISSKVPKNASTQREVMSTSVISDDNVINFSITSNAFLHQQIRRIVGSMYRVSSGIDDVEIFEDQLLRPKRGKASFVISPKGLILSNILYKYALECGLPGEKTISHL